MSIERRAIQISVNLDNDAYAKDFRELFYGSQKRRARTLFGLLERKLADDTTTFPSILTDDTFYAILNGVDLRKKSNQTILINLINGKGSGNKTVRDILFSYAFVLTDTESLESQITVSGITLDDLDLSRKQLKETLGNEEYPKYRSIFSSKRREWERNHPNTTSTVLNSKVNPKVDAVIKQTQIMLKTLLETDIDFAFNLLSKTPELENTNAGKLVDLAKLNPGAALGILSNPNLQTKISPAQAEDIFTHLLNQRRDKKVNAMLRAYIINLLNTDPAPLFGAAQLQAFFNHPSRLAEEFKIPRVLLEKYWNEGNFADNTPENKDRFLAANDRNDPNNPRKIHWFRNIFSFKGSEFFKSLYQQIFVEIKPVGAAAPALPVPPPPVEDSDDHESSVSRDQEAEAQRKAAEEAKRVEAETERKATEETARVEAERKAAAETARLDAERKAAEEVASKAAKPVISASMETESHTTKVDVAIPDDAVFETLRDKLNSFNAQRKATEEAALPAANSSPAKITASLQRPLTPELVQRAKIVVAIEKPSPPARRSHSFDSASRTVPVEAHASSLAKPGQKH